MQSLLKRYFHDLLVNSFDLDIHLECRNTLSGTSHLKVHITKVVLVAKNVCQNRKLITFFNETHGNTSNGCLKRYACSHHRQRANTNRSHRARTV